MIPFSAFSGDRACPCCAINVFESLPKVSMRNIGFLAFIFLSTLIVSCDSDSATPEPLEPNTFQATLRGDLDDSIEGPADIVNVTLNNEPRFAFRLRYDGQTLSGSRITGISMRFTRWNNVAFDEGAYSVIGWDQPQSPGAIYFNLTVSPDQDPNFLNPRGRGTLTIERKPDGVLGGSFNIDIDEPNFGLSVSGTFSIVME